MAKKEPSAPAKKKAAAPKSVKPNGRPTLFTQAVADAICERVANGDALIRICKEDNMPGLTAVYAWLRKYESFAKDYARAKEDMGETFASRTQEILNEPPVLDAITGKIDSGWVQLQRLKVDTLKWHAGKLKPKVYGERVDLNHGGQEGNPIQALLKGLGGNVIGTAKGNK